MPYIYIYMPYIYICHICPHFFPCFVCLFGTCFHHCFPYLSHVFFPPISLLLCFFISFSHMFPSNNFCGFPICIPDVFPMFPRCFRVFTVSPRSCGRSPSGALPTTCWRCCAPPRSSRRRPPGWRRCRAACAAWPRTARCWGDVLRKRCLEKRETYGNHWKILGNQWKILENHWKILGNQWKILENQWKILGNFTKSWENLGKYEGNSWKTVGELSKIWEKLWKSMGQLMENDTLMGKSWENLGEKLAKSMRENLGKPWNVLQKNHRDSNRTSWNQKHTEVWLWENLGVLLWENVLGNLELIFF